MRRKTRDSTLRRVHRIKGSTLRASRLLRRTRARPRSRRRTVSYTHLDVYKRQIHGFAGAQPADKDELILRPCDVLIPAATENVITSKNAERIQARILVEGANGPTTVKADKVLEVKGVFVVPDILANAGGVTTSYFEWVQDRMGYFWTEDEVNQRLERIMVDSFNDVLHYAVAHGVNNRIAAYMLAIDRVAYTTKQRGMYA